MAKNQDGYNSGYQWYNRFKSFSNYVPGGPYYNWKDREAVRDNEEWRESWKQGVRDFAKDNKLTCPDYR